LGSSDPFGSGPDPLSALDDLSASSGFGSQDPFGGAAAYQQAPVNPYASPAAPSYAKKSSSSKSRGSRSGLPWDKKNRRDAPYVDTAKLVLFSPVNAFSLMRRSGGDANPLLFCIYGTMIGGAFSLLYRLILDAIFTLPLMMQQGGGEQTARMVGMVVGMIIGVVVGFGMLILMTVIGSYVNAGIVHVCLKVLGGANHDFETTVRVVHYTWGATALSGVIPCVGPFIQLVANVVIMSVGLANAHETSGVKTTFAVLIPFILCIGAMVGLGVAIFAMIASAAAN